MASENKLAVLSAVERRLAAVQTVDEAKAIRDQAEALRVYAKSARLGLGVQNRAACIKILAEQRAGALLKGMGEKRGGSKFRDGTLKPLGITKPSSHRWQVMAAVPEETVRGMETEMTAHYRELTSAAIYLEATADTARQRAARNFAGIHEGLEYSSGDATGPGWMLLLGDFQSRLATIPSESIDLILTDPPYGEEHLPLWEAFGREAYRLLRPRGVLLARCGHLFLRRVLCVFHDAGLHDGWIYAEPLPGSNVRFMGRKIAVAWQPWTAVSKGAWPSGTLPWHPDLLTESPRTKTRYVWEQKWTVAAELLATFTSPGHLVLDPFAGTGAYGEAAVRGGCSWIGVEQDPAGHKTAATRLAALANSP